MSDPVPATTARRNPANPPVSTTLRVFEALVRFGPQTRSDLARRLGFTAPRMSQVVSELIGRGEVVETDLTEDRRGRPARLLDVVTNQEFFLGTRIGEHAVTSVRTDLRAQIVAATSTSLTDTDTDPDNVTAIIGDHLARLASSGDRIAGHGVCLAGQVGEDGVVEHSPFLGWDDVPLGRRMQDIRGLPTIIDNDMIGLTQDEHWFGIGTTTTQFAVLSFGVGIGLGVVANDVRLCSREETLGLIAHLPVSDSGQLCRRGHRGCAAALLTIPAIESAISVGLRRQVGFQAALALARAGDAVATRVFDDASAALGRLLAFVTSIALPRAVVVSGEASEIAQANPGLTASVLAVHLHPRAHPVPLTVRPFDASSWARGAAVRAIQTFAFTD